MGHFKYPIDAFLAFQAKRDDESLSALLSVFEPTIAKRHLDLLDRSVREELEEDLRIAVWKSADRFSAACADSRFAHRQAVGDPNSTLSTLDIGGFLSFAEENRAILSKARSGAVGLAKFVGEYSRFVASKEYMKYMFRTFDNIVLNANKAAGRARKHIAFSLNDLNAFGEEIVEEIPGSYGFSVRVVAVKARRK
jgi:hypothetical protein